MEGTVTLIETISIKFCNYGKYNFYSSQFMVLSQRKFTFKNMNLNFFEWNFTPNESNISF